MQIEAGASSNGGLNTAFNATLFCAAAEPFATFLRVSVSDGRKEVAYENVVLGRLRCGYRILQLRHPRFGTRIELCYLLLHIQRDKVPNEWATPQQQRLQLAAQGKRIEELESALASRKADTFGRDGM